MSKQLSFTTNVKTDVVRRLVSEVTLFDGSEQDAVKVRARGLWDTGASISAITPAVMRALALNPTGNMSLAGAHGKQTVFTTFVSILLPNKLYVPDHKVAVCDFSQTLDLLIGTDIITLGDFAVCNGHNQTQFSFVTPPLSAKIDFTRETRGWKSLLDFFHG